MKHRFPPGRYDSCFFYIYLVTEVVFEPMPPKRLENLSKLLKIPDFDPDKSDVNEWLATAKYSYDLARITDEQVITASILCHLPQGLAGKVRTSLTHLQPNS